MNSGGNAWWVCVLVGEGCGKHFFGQGGFRIGLEPQRGGPITSSTTANITRAVWRFNQGISYLLRRTIRAVRESTQPGRRVMLCNSDAICRSTRSQAPAWERAALQALPARPEPERRSLEDITFPGRSLGTRRRVALRLNRCVMPALVDARRLAQNQVPQPTFPRSWTIAG